MIYKQKLVNMSVFAVECIPAIITLSKDVVPNVRMAVGKLLKEAMTQTGNTPLIHRHAPLIDMDTCPIIL